MNAVLLDLALYGLVAHSCVYSMHVAVIKNQIFHVRRIPIYNMYNIILYDLSSDTLDITSHLVWFVREKGQHHTII